jgi:hypothetical protein
VLFSFMISLLRHGAKSTAAHDGTKNNALVAWAALSHIAHIPCIQMVLVEAE